MKTFSPALTLAGLIATLFIFGVSLYQTNEIKESLSTRYLGEFPDASDDLNELYLKAKKSIFIFDGLISGGVFSYPEKYHKTITILRKQSIKIPITVYVYDLDFYRKETLPPAFLKLPKSECHSLSEEEKDSILRENIKDRYKTFFIYDYTGKSSSEDLQDLTRLNECKKKYFTEDVDSVKCETFFNGIIEMMRETEKFLEREDNDDTKGVEIIHIGQEHKMFAYLADRKEAIFGFPDNIITEVAFKTRDGNFIKIMDNVIEYYEKHKDKLQYRPDTK